MRIDDQVTFASKQNQLQERLVKIKLPIDVLGRFHENPELAVKVFEFSQTLRNTWISADCAAKRRILEIVCLNCPLEGVSLMPALRKPFDVLAEGLVLKES